METFPLRIRLFLVAIFALVGIGGLLDLDGSEKSIGAGRIWEIFGKRK